MSDPQPTYFVIPDVNRIDDVEEPSVSGIDALTAEWMAREAARTEQCHNMDLLTSCNTCGKVEL